ncbi:MAG: polysaccharide export protein [Gammaproteobacteria bacterium]|nr:polysaccharide export protein [Gammaproteobacteria bacterium]
MLSWRSSRRLAAFSVLVMLVGLFPLSASAKGGYVLGPGDLIKIQVFEEEDLTIEARVEDTGSIAYPFIGHVKVRGRTPKQVQDNITKHLKGPYLVNPVVTVSILEYRPFFVNGKVEKPGGFPFQPGMTVQKAIALAQGFKKRADRERVLIIRGNRSGSKPVKVKLSDRVYPGDTVVVNRSFW